MGSVSNPDSPLILEGEIAGNAGEAGKVLKADDASLAALVAAGVAEVGKAAPGSSLPLGRLYIRTNEAGTQPIGLYVGQKPSAPILFDTTGTPADGSVTLAKIAAAIIDGTAGTPSLRSLSTGAILGSSAADTEVASRKAVETALKALAAVWRTRIVQATTISAGAAVKKYLVLNGQTSQFEPLTSLGQPWRIGIAGADTNVAGLKTKYRLKAAVTAGATAVKATMKVALFTTSIAEGKITLGEEVTGSAAEVAAGETANGVITAESGDFELADGTYAIGVVPSGATTGACAVQARLIEHNV